MLSYKYIYLYLFRWRNVSCTWKDVTEMRYIFRTENFCWKRLCLKLQRNVDWAYLLCVHVLLLIITILYIRNNSTIFCIVRRWIMCRTNWTNSCMRINACVFIHQKNDTKSMLKKCKFMTRKLFFSS